MGEKENRELAESLMCLYVVDGNAEVARERWMRSIEEMLKAAKARGDWDKYPWASQKRD